MSKEIQLKVEDFQQLVDILSVYNVTIADNNSCQVVFSKKDIQVFSKFVSGRADMYSQAIHIDDLVLDPSMSSSITAFFPDLKKFIFILNNLSKYFDTKDSTIFITGDIKMYIAVDATYFRISSSKYSIKYQLATTASIASSREDNFSSLEPSKYATKAHADYAGTLSEFLLAFKIDIKKFTDVKSMLNTLAESNDAIIKLQIPEQAKIESDVAENVLPNMLYATISDNQKLVKSSIGNKVSMEIGSIIGAAPDYLSCCQLTSTTENFVYLLNLNQLDLLSDTCSSFASAAKTLEIGISKVNLMHLNFILESKNSRSELYLSLIGKKVV